MFPYIKILLSFSFRVDFTAARKYDILIYENIILYIKKNHFMKILKSFKQLFELNINDELGKAASNNDIDTVKKMIDVGADVNHKWQDNTTPLIWASDNNNLDMIMLLIDNGADVNQIDRTNNTALLNAAFFRKISIIKILINAGVDWNYRNNKNKTFISYLSRKEMTELFDLYPEKFKEFVLFPQNIDVFDNLIYKKILIQDLFGFNVKYDNYIKSVRRKKFNL